MWPPGMVVALGSARPVGSKDPEAFAGAFYDDEDSGTSSRVS